MKVEPQKPAGNCQVIITDTVYGQLEAIAEFKSRHFGPDAAIAQAMALLDQAVSGIASNPLQYPISPELERNGITARRMMIDSGRYKVIYSLSPDGGTAYILLFLSSAQDLSAALFQEAIRQLNR